MNEPVGHYANLKSQIKKDKYFQLCKVNKFWRSNVQCVMVKDTVFYM